MGSINDPGTARRELHHERRGDSARSRADRKSPSPIRFSPPGFARL